MSANSKSIEISQNNSQTVFPKTFFPYLSTGLVLGISSISNAQDFLKIYKLDRKTETIYFQNTKNNEIFHTSFINYRIGDFHLLKKTEFNITSPDLAPEIILKQILRQGAGWIKDQTKATSEERHAELYARHHHAGIWQKNYIDKHGSEATRKFIHNIESRLSEKLLPKNPEYVSLRFDATLNEDANIANTFPISNESDVRDLKEQLSLAHKTIKKLEQQLIYKSYKQEITNQENLALKKTIAILKEIPNSPILNLYKKFRAWAKRQNSVEISVYGLFVATATAFSKPIKKLLLIANRLKRKKRSSASFGNISYTYIYKPV